MARPADAANGAHGQSESMLCCAVHIRGGLFPGWLAGRGRVWKIACWAMPEGDVSPTVLGGGTVCYGASITHIEAPSITVYAGAGRPSTDKSHSGLEHASSVFEEEEEDEPPQEDSAPALPAPILTPEGARQLSALMDGVVHDFMGMVRHYNVTCAPG